MYNAYISEEKVLYKEINAHNRATAEFKTQKKIDKLRNLAPEKLEQINDYVAKINEIAEKYGIKDRIKFDQEKFLEWQKQQTAEQIDNVPECNEEKQRDNHINENEILIN